MRVSGLIACAILSVTILTACSSEETKAFDTILKDYKQENMQAVMDGASLFKQDYPNSAHMEKVDEMIKVAEKYLADNFKPLEEKYYKTYIGVLDFGAYTGLQAEETDDKEDMYVYQGVKDYMLINYVDSLKEIGFEDDGAPSYLFNSIGVETNNTIYLKNVKYHILLMYEPVGSILIVMIS